MKRSEEILGRARECVAAEFERRLAEASRRLPHRCVYNHRQPLDVRRTVEGELNVAYNTISSSGSPTIGLCMLGSENSEEWSGTVCEDPIDAQKCPYFTPAKTKEAVLEELFRDLTDLDWLNDRMPELSALLWVLEESSAPRLSLWRRLRNYFLRIRLEPLRPAVDPAQLLPSSDENPGS